MGVLPAKSEYWLISELMLIQICESVGKQLYTVRQSTFFRCIDGAAHRVGVKSVMSFKG